MSKSNRVVWLNAGWMPTYFGFCPNKKAWKREMKRFGSDMGYPESDGRCSSFRNEKGALCVIVTIGDKFKADTHCHNGVVGLIVHEGMHVWRMFREEIGEIFPSTEFEAYAMQCISQELISAFCDTRFDLFRKAK